MNCDNKSIVASSGFGNDLEVRSFRRNEPYQEPGATQIATYDTSINAVKLHMPEKYNKNNT